MYGTVAKMRAKPGAKAALLKSMERESSEVPGAIAINVYQMDSNPDEFFLTVVFSDKEAYFANANRPETHANYLKMMEFMAAEPEWHDGEIIYSEMYSGPSK